MKIFYSALFVLSLLFVGYTESKAQQDAQFNQYMFNTLYYNPAFAGVEGLTTISAIHRSQWAGYRTTSNMRGAPTTNMVSLNTVFSTIRTGVGLHIVEDDHGPLKNMEIQLSGSHHVRLNDKTKLSLGARLGIFSQTIDFDQYMAIDPDDPLLGSGRESQVRPDLSVGAFIRNEKWYAGVSVTRLLPTEFDFGVSEMRNPLANHLYTTFGYDYEANFNLVLTPSFLVKTDFITYQFELGGLATYKEKMWGGLFYRQQESVYAIVGYGLTKDNSLKLNYSVDLTIQGREAKAATSHEVMIIYSLPVVTDAAQKIIRTPRFRL
ncbi:MAG: type IX secretion system membrane protein PorP/SprF [Cyclobacteriaceae bacterium]|nr:type IX secretion system membrane protein PorP/SprF [Cyclobacteriaceae bacterium]MCH8515044.1 type IX secretion system membrane protein PorP/SprF [Cyclobacteriaceae bacterium]